VDPDAFLSGLRADEAYEDQIAVARRLPAREAAYAELERPLHPRIEGALRRAGVQAFYTHQAEAIESLRSGVHTIVATGTASGKSLCYQVPVIEALATHTDATALYLSPTKALAQDQLRALERLDMVELRAEIYDGDTPTPLRAGIRRHANLLLTNPDMLHVGILPHHELWSRFLKGLRFVVVDEAHALRGIFGSHVALVLRRLRRIARVCGATPVFAFASATIGNPGAHASALAGVQVRAVTEDRAPRGPRTFVFWNPPRIEEGGRRRSSNTESAWMVARLVSERVRTLVFSKSRVSAELVARYARQRLPNGRGERIVAYRAGYLPAERREIEAALRSGELAAVSATNALELGIDVGDLEAVVLNGFPGTVASAWQQAGRAGREGQPSIAVVVPLDEPLDQYYTAHPNDFFAKPHESALVDPSNPRVLRPHLGCAAYERPLHEGDESFFSTSQRELAAEMRSDGELRERRGRLYWAGRSPPAPEVDIRSAGGTPYRVVEDGTGRLIGTVGDARAMQTVHPGAIYMHQGETFRVRALHIDQRVALVEPHDAPEYTQARSDDDLIVLSRELREPMSELVQRCLGLVEVTEQVIAYQRKRVSSGEVLAVEDLDLPPESLVTRAVWYEIDAHALRTRLQDLPGHDVLLGSLHAAEHAAIGILPVFAMCERTDIGGLSTNRHPDTGLPTIFIYDGHPMGAGISERAFDVAGEHLSATRDHVRDCACEAGCPSCVQSPKCGNWNEPLHKAGAVRVLDLLLG
jgi:DEAD/DEAH box helicase domain-containing protein